MAESTAQPGNNTPTLQWKRILAPIDFSPTSEAALAYALKLASVVGAEVYVCHVIPIPHVLDAFYERGFPPPESLKRITHKARKRIQELVRSAGFSVPLRLRFYEGEAPKNILEQAVKLKADLIVMGTHGRRGAKRFFLGSVAEAVVRHAPCPVLTLRS